MLQPRHAVAYHFFNEEGTRDGINERMAVSSDDTWDVDGPTPSPTPDNKFPKQESDFSLSGRCDVSDVEGPAFKEFKKKHGLK